MKNSKQSLKLQKRLEHYRSNQHQYFVAGQWNKYFYWKGKADMVQEIITSLKVRRG